jgi:DNA-binding response OmpR family regulator
MIGPKADRPLSVLFVDRDAVTRQMARNVFAEFPPTTVAGHIMSDRESALAWLEDHIVDLLFTEAADGDGAGIELARAAKDRNAWTQVVLLSAHLSKEAALDALDLGIGDALRKPLDDSELRKTINFHIGRVERWRAALARRSRTAAPTPSECGALA